MLALGVMEQLNSHVPIVAYVPIDPDGAATHPFGPQLNPQFVVPGVGIKLGHGAFWVDVCIVGNGVFCKLKYPSFPKKLYQVNEVGGV